MPAEAYTGTRLGRPRLLLIVNAAVLAGTLGLAWWQTRESRALGAERRLGDTPLVVRPPRGWHADPRDPHSFVLPVADRSRRAVREFERRIQFEFTRLPTFQPLAQILSLPAWTSTGEVVRARRARLGRYDAIEVHQIVPVQVGWRRLRGQIITRFTCLPRGHLIKVVYEPLIDLRPADAQILDEVCQSLRLDDATLNGAPSDYLARAGLTLPLEPDWQVVGSDFEGVPGVYLGGATRDGPAWAIGMLRTWLAAGRTPADLLRDVAAQEWLVWDTEDLIRQEQRADGAMIATIRHPQLGRAGTVMPAVWVVSRAPALAVILFVYAGPEDAQLADGVAERLAAEMRIAPLKELAELAPAEATGAQLAADLRKNGAVARWGRESVETTYRRVDQDETIVVRRGAVQRDPAQGYEGSLWRRAGRNREERQAWFLDAGAATYRWQAEFTDGRTTIQLAEQCLRPAGDVTRVIRVEGQEPRRFTFTPGAAFVPPPAEEIVKGWVARREAASAIVMQSTVLGPASHTAWLRHLPADGPYPRVLVQQDYWPLGSIEAYDDSRAQAHYEQYPDGEYRRIR